MTELTSTDGTAGTEGFRRSAVPSPPPPPAPLDAEGAQGPATSAMSAMSVPPELLTNVAPAVTTLPSDAPDSRSARVRAATELGRPRRTDRRPQVAVRGPRRAKLVIRRIDPWSVLKFSFLISVCMVIVWVVAISSLFTLLRTMHVFVNINDVLTNASSDPQTKVQINPKSHDVTEWAAILGAVNALLFTALATLGAFLYNLVAVLVGGIEVSLGERE